MQVDKAEIKKQVIVIANEMLELEEALSKADMAALLEGDLTEYLDSIKLLGLVVSIEDHFKICLAPEDDSEIKRLDDVVDIITRLLAEDAA